MKNTFLYFSLIILSFSVTAQNKELALQIVKELASEQYHGRGYVKNGDKKATKYIKQKFTTFGVKPFGKDYFQKFSFDINTHPSQMFLQIGDIELTPGEDYIITPSSPKVKGTYNLIYLSKEDMLSPNIWQPKIKKSLKQILVIENRSKGWSKVEKDAVKEVINSLKNKAYPAAACIELTDQKLTWYMSKTPSPRAYFIVKTDKIEKLLAKEATVKVKNKWIEGYTSQNVIGYIEGTHYPDSFVVFTGHYDHLGRMGAKTYFPGANDNASGIAMLLTLAEYYQKNPPKYSIAFMAFGAEEVGLIGSVHYVKNPYFDLKKIKFLLNMDISGTGNDGIQVVNGSVYKEEFEKFVSINQKDKLLKEIKIRGEACNSDHCLFHRKGVPSFFIYTLGGIQAYHDIYDKAETLPLYAYNQYFQLLIKFVEQL